MFSAKDFSPSFSVPINILHISSHQSSSKQSISSQQSIICRTTAAMPISTANAYHNGSNAYNNGSNANHNGSNAFHDRGNAYHDGSNAYRQHRHPKGRSSQTSGSPKTPETAETAN